MKKISVESIIERWLFASRWLMAPIYIGLAVALLLLLAGFFMEMAHLVGNLTQLGRDGIVLGVLSLIDIALAGNLILIVIFSGYENFVSKMDISGHEDDPEWKKSVDFSTLKLKLIASIVAISAIRLLEIFMDIKEISPDEVKWSVIIHLVFVVSGVMMALMDRIAAGSKILKEK